MPRRPPPFPTTRELMESITTGLLPQRTADGFPSEGGGPPPVQPPVDPPPVQPPVDPPVDPDPEPEPETPEHNRRRQMHPTRNPRGNYETR